MANCRARRETDCLASPRAAVQVLGALVMATPRLARTSPESVAVGPLRAWEAEPSLISERTGASALLEQSVLCASVEVGGLEAEDEQRQ